MFEAASFSLCSLLDFFPLVRGGEGAEKSLGSEASSELVEGTKTASPAREEVLGSEVWVSLMEPEEVGLGENDFAGGALTLVDGAAEGLGRVSPCVGSSYATFS